MRPLILIGGGGHCKSVIEAAESCGIPIKGILDMPEFIGTECLGYPIIGSDNEIPQYVSECDYVVTLGFIKDPSRRIKIHQLIENAGGSLATVIASTAHVSRHSVIEPGSVVLHGACVNAGSHIGKGAIINTLANIEHDVSIGDYSHISTGAMINGGVTIGDNCFIGSGTIVNNTISISSNCIIGSGSKVIKDIKISGIYIGTPVKKI